MRDQLWLWSGRHGRGKHVSRLRRNNETRWLLCKSCWFDLVPELNASIWIGMRDHPKAMEWSSRNQHDRAGLLAVRYMRYTFLPGYWIHWPQFITSARWLAVWWPVPLGIGYSLVFNPLVLVLNVFRIGRLKTMFIVSTQVSHTWHSAHISTSGRRVGYCRGESTVSIDLIL